MFNRNAIVAAVIALGLGSAGAAIAQDKMSRDTYKACLLYTSDAADE